MCVLREDHVEDRQVRLEIHTQAGGRVACALHTTCCVAGTALW